MREKRKGPISIAGGLVDSVAATVRRMQRDREPRVLAYDPTGYARLIQPEARGHERMLEIAEEMIALGGSDGAAQPRVEAAKAKTSPGRAAKPAAKARSAGAAKAKPAAGSAKPRARRAARPKKK